MDNGASSYRRYLNGEEEAFDEIVEELFEPLVFFIDRYVRDIYAAEDIAIDAFSDLIVHRHRYHFGVSLKTYLFMIGRSRALNYIKSCARRRELPLEEAACLEDRKDMEQRLLLDEQKRAVNAALGELPEAMRLAVHLVYFEALSYEEAARVMKKSRKQIDNLLYRAKRMLRAILEKEVAEL